MIQTEIRTVALMGNLFLLNNFFFLYTNIATSTKLLSSLYLNFQASAGPRLKSNHLYHYREKINNQTENKLF